MSPRTDCNGNGQLDEDDIADGTSQDCSGNGIPDECEPDCNGNGIADSCDVVAGTSQDRNGNEVPGECEPELIGIADSATAAFDSGVVDTIISPRVESVALHRFFLRASQDFELIASEVTYTGPITEGGTVRRGSDPRALPTAPAVFAFFNQGDGLHRIEIDPAPAVGEWLKLRLTVRGSTSVTTTLDVWLAHHPGDINRDGLVDERDATAFGELFGNPVPPDLIDLNDDGSVNVRDATTYGDIWNGRNGASRRAKYTVLPRKPD